MYLPNRTTTCQTYSLLFNLAEFLLAIILASIFCTTLATGPNLLVLARTWKYIFIYIYIFTQIYFFLKGLYWFHKSSIYTFKLHVYANIWQQYWGHESTCCHVQHVFKCVFFVLQIIQSILSFCHLHVLRGCWIQSKPK